MNFFKKKENTKPETKSGGLSDEEWAKMFGVTVSEEEKPQNLGANDREMELDTRILTFMISPVTGKRLNTNDAELIKTDPGKAYWWERDGVLFVTDMFIRNEEAECLGALPWVDVRQRNSADEELKDIPLLKYKLSPRRVYIGGNVTEVYPFAFTGLVTLSEVIFLTDIIKVHPYAFVGCYLLTTVSFQGVKEIGEDAFGNCMNLKNIILPKPCMDGVDAKAFEYCPGNPFDDGKSLSFDDKEKREHLKWFARKVLGD